MTRAEIAAAHENEWHAFRETILAPCQASFDEKEIKAAKTLADAIRITQAGERAAADFGEGRDADNELSFSWEEQGE